MTLLSSQIITLERLLDTTTTQRDKLLNLCQRSLHALHEDEFPMLRQELRKAIHELMRDPE